MMKIDRADAAFAAALARQAPRPAPAHSSTAARSPAPAPLPPDSIPLGLTETGAPLGIDIHKLLDGRLLVQGISGAGKSWTLRRLLEQSAERIQQVVIDPEGEFRSLAEQLGHLHIDGSKLDLAGFAALGWRLRSSRISAVIDISDCDRETQMKSVTFLLNAMIECGQELWHAALIAIDEAHLLAPYGVQDEVPQSVRKASAAAITHLMSRGRKRGLAGVIATQRLVRLAKSVASECQNYLIGLNTLDLDIKRAAETIGWDARRASDRLPTLEPGSFVAVGPAFSQSPVITKIGPALSRHIGAAPAITAPIAASDVDALRLIDIDGLMRESAESAGGCDERRLGPGNRAVRAFVRDAGFVAAPAIYGALKQLLPHGALVSELPRHLGFSGDDVTAAIALLESHGILEIDVSGAPAVRIAHDFAKWKV